MLTKDQILSAQDRKVDTVFVPEWGGTIRVASMTAFEQEQLPKLNEKYPCCSLAIVVATCAVNEDLSKMFALEEIPALAAKSPKALDRVFKKCLEINDLTGEKIEEKKTE